MALSTQLTPSNSEPPPHVTSASLRDGRELTGAQRPDVSERCACFPARTKG